MRKRKSGRPRSSIAAKHTVTHLRTHHSLSDPPKFWKRLIAIRKKLPKDISYSKSIVARNGSGISLIWAAPSPAVFRKFALKVGLIEQANQASVIFVRELRPVITKIFLFSSITPGGGVIVGGENFLSQEGQFRLYSKQFIGGYVNLQAVQWGNQFAAGQIPNITAVRDDPNASLAVVTVEGKKSNRYPVKFLAKKDVVKLEFLSTALSVVKFSEAANVFNVQLATQSTVCGSHTTYLQSEDDTDVYRIQLKNGWTYHHFNWNQKDGIDGGPFGQRPEPFGRSEFNLRIHWFCDFFIGNADYQLDIYITGPAGVPFE